MTLLCWNAMSCFLRLCKARAGGTAIAFAILLPVLAFVAVGAVDFTDAAVDRSRMQGVADQAALAAATQLAVDTSYATAQRAQSFAQSQLNGLISDCITTITSQVANQAALAAATQLAVDTSYATAQRAQSFAQSQLNGLISDCITTITSQVVNNGTGVRVAISGTRPAL